MLDDVPTDAPNPGDGRVVLDTPNVKASVVEVAAIGAGVVSYGGYTAQATSIATRPVCNVTPCVVDLRRGAHTLVFQSTTDEDRKSVLALDVKSKPMVVRHEVGSQTHHRGLRVGGTSLLTLGLTSALVGGLFAGLGAAASSRGVSSSLGEIGTPLLVGGVLGTAVGAGMLYFGRPEVQKGATTEFPLESVSPEKPIGPTTAGNTW